ncbi:VIT1/CCC1 transporter family protein [archaeon]|nr:VIT1/CCC1 transporter family protein [archaeon]
MGNIKESLLNGMQGIAFGLVEGIIFVLGLSLGISALNSSPLMVFVIALTGGIADAFANSVGFFVSEEVESEQGIAKHSKKEVFTAALLVFIATILFIFITITPYLFVSIGSARIASMAIGLLLLFGFGAYHATQSKESRLFEGLKFAFYGLLASIICYFIGSQLPGLFLA